MVGDSLGRLQRLEMVTVRLEMPSGTALEKISKMRNKVLSHRTKKTKGSNNCVVSRGY